VSLSVPGQVALLFRRAGFGASSSEIEAASAKGYSSTVEQLVGALSGPDPGADAVAAPTLTPYPSDPAQLTTASAAKKVLERTLAIEHVALTNWWLERMVATSNPLREKLTFLLHGHFPTGISKVKFPIYMYAQNQIFRTMGPGTFDVLTQAVAADPAMLIWLDADLDKAADPNENFARELMERFTMGLGTYSEADVRAGATCFSGWQLDRTTASLVINPRQHSTVAQTFLGVSPVSTGQQIIEMVTHSSASASYVPAAFWSHLAYPVTPSDPVVRDLAPGYNADHSIANLLSAIFTHPDFVSSASSSGLIKQPTEYVVGAMRTLGISATQFTRLGVQPTLGALGQVLFDPPSVGGWSQNEYWLSTAAAMARWEFAHQLGTAADLSTIADEAPSSRVDATASLLGLSGWSTTTASALRQAEGNPQTLLTLALVSPEYVNN
jgi:uncharacterized protein (DUF1800 family)